MDFSPSPASGEPLSFACPRCGVEVADMWYGPCSACRRTLRASIRGVPHEIAAAYEPKMNVTPNAVATKD